MAGGRAKCQQKQKKSKDQRAPVTGYYLVKEPGHEILSII